MNENPNKPFDSDFREVGFSSLARDYPRSRRQIEMIAAWNNIPSSKLQEAAKYFPNANMEAAWGRVEAAAQKFFNTNPPTIPVGVIRVDDGTRQGTLCVRRALPGYGHGLLALPSGFQEMGETLEEAIARETLEETGLQTDPAYWKLTHIVGVESNSRNLAFYEYQFIVVPSNIPKWEPNDEISETLVWYNSVDPQGDLVEVPEEWAFPTHYSCVRHIW